MKLVEILARELDAWPVGAGYARQDADMEICFSGFTTDNGTDTSNDFQYKFMADDNKHDGVIGMLRVNENEWQAERQRIAME